MAEEADSSASGTRVLARGRSGHPCLVTEPLYLGDTAENDLPADLEPLAGRPPGAPRCELYQDTTQTVFGTGPRRRGW